MNNLKCIYLVSYNASISNRLSEVEKKGLISKIVKTVIKITEKTPELQKECFLCQLNGI